MMQLMREGQLAEARGLQFSITTLTRMLFALPSPAPLKAALDLLVPGLGGPVRPPLADVSEEFKRGLAASFRGRLQCS